MPKALIFKKEVFKGTGRNLIPAEFENNKIQISIDSKDVKLYYSEDVSETELINILNLFIEELKNPLTNSKN